MLPEAELWTEVIALSLRDLTHPKNPYAAREAREWFSSDTQEIGSFCWVCQLIDLEPNFIRKALAKRQQQPVVSRLRNLSVDAPNGASGRTFRSDLLR
jgi:hypothetical protein